MTRIEPLPPPRAPSGLGRIRVGRWFLLVGTVLLLAFAAAITVTLTTLNETRDARVYIIDVIDPLVLHTLEVSTALSTEESAIRGYGRTNEQSFLTEYSRARAAETTAEAAIQRLLPAAPEAGADLGQLRTAVDAWRRDYADAIIRNVPTQGREAAPNLAEVNSTRFGAVRNAIATQQLHLEQLHRAGSTRLEEGWDTFYRALVALAALLVLSALVFALLVRYVVLRPVASLAEQVRAVAQGDFDRELRVAHPAEMAELSSHADAMRRRIIAEWRTTSRTQRTLEDQAAELKRSNGELEQFAYVASHDLQEPLRKVASFTQMLEQRYGDQLDDRAKQYIKFAVDGAKRMQLLINDLLDFSRVGRVSNEREPVSTEEIFAVAVGNLAAPIEDTDATVTHDVLPVVNGNRLLLTQLFQNLVGNAIKFRSENPPVIHIGVRRDGQMWEFSCADNGIGVDQKYADRIFLIFQRLHPRDVYPGTGIGLALCRKIVEYHGGRIWLEKEPDTPGTTFRWTLEATDE
ncbi:sensor histidine kinase [Acrocarpospora macrocephala]|uniref:histidine kinase n=1 Tax=Acrocarpospora macrocephala TaxID=150177 RepID=A0A5M3WJ94_9ACTN|nr:sensor histidine kinase [Acrocarpospora macrocephala]GES09265.1 histidine kinase [Acrocarpospora macrocephala]